MNTVQTEKPWYHQNAWFSEETPNSRKWRQTGLLDGAEYPGILAANLDKVAKEMSVEFTRESLEESSVSNFVLAIVRRLHDKGSRYIDAKQLISFIQAAYDRSGLNNANDLNGWNMTMKLEAEIEFASTTTDEYHKITKALHFANNERVQSKI
jgi:hypothetical protein